MELALPEKKKAENFGADPAGQLLFLKWFTNHLKTYYPNAEFINRVQAYKSKLYYLIDNTLWNLLENIEMLYYKPVGMPVLDLGAIVKTPMPVQNQKTLF